MSSSDPTPSRSKEMMRARAGRSMVRRHATGSRACARKSGWSRGLAAPRLTAAPPAAFIRRALAGKAIEMFKAQWFATKAVLLVLAAVAGAASAACGGGDDDNGGGGGGGGGSL